MQNEYAPAFRFFGETEIQRQIGVRQMTNRFARPFGQTDGVVAEIFAQAGIHELLWMIETIKIKVI